MKARAGFGALTRTRAWLAGVTLLLGFAAGNQASAYTSYTYVDVDPVNEYLSAGESVSGTFDIVNPGSYCFFWICDAGGFDPATQTATSARLGFLFFDLDYAPEEASILLGPDVLMPLQEEGFAGSVFFVHLEKFNANLQVLAELSDTGQLDWTVIAPSNGYHQHHWGHWGFGHRYGNDFFLKGAVLTVEAAIPEPSAALLFAVGFGVVGTATRRRRAA